MDMGRSRAIVIGAGAGGLTAAAHLARRGFQVTVVEKNELPGGRCARVVRDAHHFDVGPTLFVMPNLYEQEFAALGESMHDLLDLHRVDPTYHLFFGDGQQLVLTSDFERMRAQLEAIEPGSFEAFLRYLDEGRQHYDLAMDRLVRRNFRSLAEFLTPSNILTFLRLRALTKHYGHMRAFFDEPRLKAAFTFQDMYMGLSPFEAPATFSMLQFTEFGHGVWFPRGGMYAVVEAMKGLAERWGAEFLFSAPVERILTRDSRVGGVALADGRRLEADVVVANADLPYVYRELLPPDGSAERLERRQFSCSTINFLWGLDRPYPQIPPHALFLSDAYRRNFEAIQRDHTLAEDPSVYFHAPARLDPSLAPPGQETLIGIVPVGHLSEDSSQDWEALKAQARRILLSRLAELGVTDLDAHLKFEICFTPLDWRSRFNLVKGATHGLAHTLLQMGYFRPHNRHARLRNLYFAGASTHPGTGLPTALVSGRLAAERILDDLPPES
jgi:phytoene desaturase